MSNCVTDHVLVSRHATGSRASGPWKPTEFTKPIENHIEHCISDTVQVDYQTAPAVMVDHYKAGERGIALVEYDLFELHGPRELVPAVPGDRGRFTPMI